MKKTLTALAFATSFAWLAAPASAAITLAFTSSATHINVGDSVTVQVGISGLDAEVLSGFDLNFLYSPSVLAFGSFTYTSAPLGTQTALNSSTLAGDLGFDVVSLDDDATLVLSQPNAFNLFSFVLSGAANGSSNFTLGGDPDFQRAFSGLAFNPLAVSVGNICISVGTGSCTTSIPEPGTIGLTGLALAATMLPAARRLRRRNPWAWMCA